MQRLLGHLDFVAIYLDDILIFSDSEEQHKEHIGKVLQILRDNNLYASKEKSEFFAKEMTFLGHRIHAGGTLSPDPSKLSNWPVPRDLNELQSFLGFINFYRRFIPDLAQRSAALYQSKQVPFVWTADQQTAFEYLRGVLISAPILQIPDPARPFRIERDASDDAIGAVILQEDKNTLKWLPVGYFSRAFIDCAERNFPVQEKKLLALLCALRKWKHYVFGYVVQVITDHQSLTTFLYDHKNPTGRKARWLIELSEYPVEIIYRKGAKILIADTLS